MSDETATTQMETEQLSPEPLPPIPKREAGAKRSEAIEDYIEASLRRWGGAAGFSKRLYQEFVEARPGTPARARILDMMLQLIKLRMPYATSGTSEMSNEELKKELCLILEEAGEVPDELEDEPVDG